MAARRRRPRSTTLHERRSSASNLRERRGRRRSLFLSIRAGKAGGMDRSREGAGDGKIKGLSRDARQVTVFTSFFREVVVPSTRRDQLAPLIRLNCGA